MKWTDNFQLNKGKFTTRNPLENRGRITPAGFRENLFFVIERSRQERLVSFIRTRTWSFLSLYVNCSLLEGNWSCLRYKYAETDRSLTEKQGWYKSGLGLLLFAAISFSDLFSLLMLNRGADFLLESLISYFPGAGDIDLNYLNLSAPFLRTYILLKLIKLFKGSYSYCPGPGVYWLGSKEQLFLYFENFILFLTLVAILNWSTL